MFLFVFVTYAITVFQVIMICCKKFLLYFQRSGTHVCVCCYRDNMPSHFKFKEYCPVVFRNLRERFDIDEEVYLVRSNFLLFVSDFLRCPIFRL